METEAGFSEQWSQQESPRNSWGVYVFLNSEGLSLKFLMEGMTSKKKNQ